MEPVAMAQRPPRGRAPGKKGRVNWWWFLTEKEQDAVVAKRMKAARATRRRRGVSDVTA
jgi:hypothetical protein